jgi:hypothetical protein
MGLMQYLANVGNAFQKPLSISNGAFAGLQKWALPGMDKDENLPFSNPLSGALYGATRSLDEPFTYRQSRQGLTDDTKNHWWAGVTDLAGDVALDPTTYAGGVGKIGKVAELAKGGSKGAELLANVGKLGKLPEDAGKLAHLGQFGRRFATATTLGGGDVGIGLLGAGAPAAWEAGASLLGRTGAKSAAIEKILGTKGGQLAARAAEKTGTKVLGQKIPDVLREGDYDVVGNVLKDADLPISRVATPVETLPGTNKPLPKIPETLTERDLGMLSDLWGEDLPGGKPTVATVVSKQKTSSTSGKRTTPGLNGVATAKTPTADPWEKSIGAPEPTGSKTQIHPKIAALIEPKTPKPTPTFAEALSARDLPGDERAAVIQAADEALLARRAPKVKKPKAIKDTRPANAGAPMTREEEAAFTRTVKQKKAKEDVPPFLRKPTVPTREEIEASGEFSHLRGAAKTAAINKKLRSFGNG